VQAEGLNDKFIVLVGSGHSANLPFNKGVDQLLGIPSIDINNTSSIMSPDLQQPPDTLVRGNGKESTYLFTPLTR